MAERTRNKFVIDKWKKNGKIVSLSIRRKSRIYDPVFSFRVRPPIPVILFRTPEWLKEFVDRMNKGEIKIR